MEQDATAVNSPAEPKARVTGHWLEAHATALLETGLFSSERGMILDLVSPASWAMCILVSPFSDSSRFRHPSALVVGWRSLFTALPSSDVFAIDGLGIPRKIEGFHDAGAKAALGQRQFKNQLDSKTGS